MQPHVIQSFAAATGVPGYGRIKLASVLSSRRDVDGSEDGGMWQMQMQIQIQIQIQLQSSKLFSSLLLLLSRLQAGRYIKSTPYGTVL
jgi:hypothetical protein